MTARQELQPNTKLQNGKYRIVRKLSQGAFGITYLAMMHEQGNGCDLEIEVAIKEFFMKETNNRSSDTRSVTGSESELFVKYKDKFKTEAKNLKKMEEYDDIVKVFEVFEENNTAYYSMEYIEGSDLDTYIKQLGCIEEGMAVEYIKKIATALKHLHDISMLHLDLKPKNIMRRLGGKLYLIDFGLSKQYDENGNAESSSTVGLGTSGYAPLEQATFKGGFAPTLDIYALGATLYKMLTGITAPESTDIFNNGFNELRQRMATMNISQHTINIVEKAMQMRKGDRYQTIDEFLAAINSYDGNAVLTQRQTLISTPPPFPKSEEDGTIISREKPKMFAHPFSFKGRIRRLEFNLSYFIIWSAYYIIVTLIVFLMHYYHIFKQDTGFVILFILMIPAYWFLWAQSAKRCHDLGHNGWWQLIPFYIFWLIFQNSQNGTNEYGDNPKNE